MKTLLMLAGIILISFPSVVLGTDLDVSKLDSQPAMWMRADEGVSHTAGQVSNWEDFSGNGRHATQANASLQPLLIGGALNGYPVVQFATDSLSFNGDFLVGSSYTVIAVEARDRYGVANFFIGGSDRSTNRNLILGYENVALLRQAHFGNDLNAVVPAYNGLKEFALTTFWFDKTVGRSIFRHGEVAAEDTNSTALISYTNPTIGSFPAYNYYYEGDIAELVFFDSALSECDRSRVESYLAEKYGLSALSDPFDICTGDLLTDLAADIIALNLQTGLSNSLDAKLTAVFDALTDLNENNDASALNRLNAFINEVEAQRGKKITDAQADYLIAAVLEVMETI